MKVLTLLVSLIWLPLINTPQGHYLISKDCKVSIAGTSTLHDWTMETKTVKGDATIDIADNSILSIQEIRVEIPVESLKSGNSKMDNNAYEALKSGQHKTISFQLKGFDKIKLINGRSALEVNGNLTIAGKTRTEKILVNYRTDKNGNLFVNGSKEIKMTDYGVTPPEVMFGTVKTGNAITINFELNLAQSNIL